MAATLIADGLGPELARPLDRAAARWAEAARAGNEVTAMERLGLGRETPLGAAVEAALARTAGTLDEALNAANVWFNQQMTMLSPVPGRRPPDPVHRRDRAGRRLNLSAFDLVQDLRDDAHGRELPVSAVAWPARRETGQDACLDGLGARLDQRDGTLTLPVVGTRVAPWEALREASPMTRGGRWCRVGCSPAWRCRSALRPGSAWPSASPATGTGSR